MSNFWRSLEIPLVTCKVELLFTRDPNCVVSNLDGASTFTITDAKHYVPAVTFFNKKQFEIINILEIKDFIGIKNIKANIFRVQSNNSIMHGYFCFGFIDFMFVGKKLTDFTTLFSPYGFEKNDSKILKYLKDELFHRNN